MEEGDYSLGSGGPERPGGGMGRLSPAPSCSRWNPCSWRGVETAPWRCGSWRGREERRHRWPRGRHLGGSSLELWWAGFSGQPGWERMGSGCRRTRGTLVPTHSPQQMESPPAPHLQAMSVGEASGHTLTQLGSACLWGVDKAPCGGSSEPFLPIPSLLHRFKPPGRSGTF